MRKIAILCNVEALIFVLLVSSVPALCKSNSDYVQEYEAEKFLELMEDYEKMKKNEALRDAGKPYNPFYVRSKPSSRRDDFPSGIIVLIFLVVGWILYRKRKLRSKDRISKETASSQSSSQQKKEDLVQVSGDSENFKKCPFCAEAVRKEAIKCRFCGSDLLTQQEEKKSNLLSGSPCPRCGKKLISETCSCGYELDVGKSKSDRQSEPQAGASEIGTDSWKCICGAQNPSTLDRCVKCQTPRKTTVRASLAEQYENESRTEKRAREPRKRTRHFLLLTDWSSRIIIVVIALFLGCLISFFWRKADKETSEHTAQLTEKVESSTAIKYEPYVHQEIEKYQPNEQEKSDDKIAQLEKAVNEIPENDLEMKLDLYEQLLKTEPTNSVYRNKVIEYLERIVIPIPASEYEKNLVLYRKLFKLEPDNARYKQKVNYYEAKLSEGQRKKNVQRDGLSSPPLQSVNQRSTSNYDYSEESCYDLGYRWGLIATKAFLGLPYDPEDDFVMPERCRGTAQAKRGIYDATKRVYESQGISTE